jgi:hypothetical protein
MARLPRMEWWLAYLPPAPPEHKRKRPMTHPTDKEIDAWIDALEDDAVDLSEWEVEAMREIREQWAHRRRLTDVQVAIVKQLYDRVR